MRVGAGNLGDCNVHRVGAGKTKYILHIIRKTLCGFSQLGFDIKFMHYVHDFVIALCAIHTRSN